MKGFFVLSAAVATATLLGDASAHARTADQRLAKYFPKEAFET
jgi:hypothetical protein